jgi:hypothetical protein
MARKTDEKKNAKDAKNSGTHFEQISIDMVKKIAEVDAPTQRKTDAGNLFFEPPSSKVEPYSVRAELLFRERH